MSAWKTVQSKNKVKKRTRLAILFLGLILLLIIFGNLVKFTQTLFSPWKIQNATSKNYIWDGEFNLNLVVRKEQTVFVLVFNPKDEKAILINIPDQTLVSVPSGFGDWQIRSVYDLGGPSPNGALLLEETLTSLLGIPIDGFLDIGELKEVKDGDEMIAKFGKNLFGGFMLIPSIKTDLTLWELIRLKMGLLSVRFDKVEKLDLFGAGGLEKSYLPDGTEVFRPDLIRIDGIIASSVADPAIQFEHKNIAIFNAADIGGIAKSAARVVTNIGGNAIITTNHAQKIRHTQVIGEASQTLKRLIQIFEKCGDDCDRIDPKDEDLVSSRAQINIILGEDYSLLNR